MGWTPAQVDTCSLWEFLAAREGWIKANTASDAPGSPTPEEHDAMLAKWG